MYKKIEDSNFCILRSLSFLSFHKPNLISIKKFLILLFLENSRILKSNQVIVKINLGFNIDSLTPGFAARCINAKIFPYFLI